ncbi:MAG TPA: acylphosphatase [Devosia sp.]|nr:acylphosphatase [Devosia sp.]
MTTERRVHVIVSGTVQGVGYRAWTADTARRHHLSGWVRNRRDGSVEAVFAGSQPAIDAMLSDCHNGPPSSDVTAVHATETWEPVTPGFHILPTV